METLSFALGVLSVVAATFVVIIVLGIVKVIKQQKQIQYLETTTDDRIRDLRRLNDEIYRRMDDRFESMGRIIEDDRKELNRKISQSISYTDSRIDKLIDTYFEYKNINKNNKEIIKG